MDTFKMEYQSVDDIDEMKKSCTFQKRNHSLF